MKTFFLLFILTISGIRGTQALLISEVMSNPTGDDSGREWIEVYNNTSSPVDISGLSISIKGGTAVAASSVSGGTIIQANGYAVIGSVASGATKFSQDYPSYTGVLMKASISLVNTGLTSIDIKLAGSTVDSLPSYTAAKEGGTLSLISGSFVLGVPTPGSENQADSSSGSGGSSGGSGGSSTATTSETQVTVPQMTAPLADIVLYVPFTRTVVAGAPTEFSISATNRAGKVIDKLSATWAFGDGGSGTGTTTIYRYAYPGRYMAYVEAGNGLISGVGYTRIHVVSPDLQISSVGMGKYGAYVDVYNPNSYDLDLSQWKLCINGALFSFPKNTVLLSEETTRFSGLAMGFASMNVATSTFVKIVFPNLEEVVVYQPTEEVRAVHDQAVLGVATTTLPATVPVKKITVPVKRALSTATTTSTSTTKVLNTKSTKDTRLVTFMRSLFGK